MEVFGEAKAVDKALPALMTDMDPPIAMHPAMPFKTSWVWEPLPTQRAREGSATRVETDMAFQGSGAAEDPATLATLVLKQSPTNDW